MMRHAPIVLAGLFVAITIPRVASLSANTLGGGLLGWLFSIGLALGVFVSAYWLRWDYSDPQYARLKRDVYRASLVSLTFFVVVDTACNWAEVYLYMARAGLLADPITKTVGGIYAIFPTLAVALLGYLAGKVSKAPLARKGLMQRIEIAIATLLDTKLPAPVEQVALIEMPKPITKQRAIASYDAFAKRKDVSTLTAKDLIKLGVPVRTAYNWVARYRQTKVQ